MYLMYLVYLMYGKHFAVKLSKTVAISQKNIGWEFFQHKTQFSDYELKQVFCLLQIFPPNDLPKNPILANKQNNSRDGMMK